MRTNKLILPFRQSTVLGETIAIYEMLVDDLIVVCGRQIQSLRKDFHHRRMRWIENPDADKGPETSLRAGLQALNPKTHAVLIAHGDMPMIQSDTVAAMIRLFQPQSIIIPRHRGRKGHPILIDVGFVRDCLDLQLSMPLREVIHRYPNCILYLDTDDTGILLDIDHWDDYHRFNIP